MAKVQNIDERRGGQELSQDEITILSDALDILEKSFDEEHQPVVAEVIDYDDEYVDIFVKFEKEDGSNDENMALERSMLDGSKPAKEVATWIY